MDNLGYDYMAYLQNTVFSAEELDSWAIDERVSGNDDSSSSEGVRSPSTAASKNIVMERNRRTKLKERLFALRAVVPNISKMDRASIIKDAIDYIQNLHEQERRVKTELYELESGQFKNITGYDQFDQEVPLMQRPKRMKTGHFRCESFPSTTFPIEVMDLSVSYMGERIVVVSLTCCKRADSMVKLCEVFESLKLKIITANITAVSGRLLKTVFIEAEQEERDCLKIEIERAIASLVNPQNLMSF